MKTNSLGFIGGGRITKILLQGFSNKSVKFDSVKVFDPNNEVFNNLSAMFPEIVKAENTGEAASQDIVFIAVHPPLVMETLQAIKDIVSEATVVVSLAPKITLEKMGAILATKNLARMIPNATSYINEGFNPVTFNSGFDKKVKKQFVKLIKKLGKPIETEEPKLESYAIISAMLPTYFWFQWQEMENIAKEIGLTPEEAQKTVSSTLKKALKIYYKSGLTPAQVMDLIPVKPIGENEAEITEIYRSRLMDLFNKIKP
ncbi:MAG: NAD(P)-binding domain-containing protein [Prolixibacteraceae bacterium]|nr:NAD(P)-binding domain-containing protein [Prolixibacteraceae bacterium]